MYDRSSNKLFRLHIQRGGKYFVAEYYYINAFLYVFVIDAIIFDGANMIHANPGYHDKSSDIYFDGDKFVNGFNSHSPLRPPSVKSSSITAFYSFEGKHHGKLSFTRDAIR